MLYKDRKKILQISLTGSSRIILNIKNLNITTPIILLSSQIFTNSWERPESPNARMPNVSNVRNAKQARILNAQNAEFQMPADLGPYLLAVLHQLDLGSLMGTILTNLRF